MVEVILGAPGWMPAGRGMGWEPWVLVRHVASDLLMGLLYCCVPLLLLRLRSVQGVSATEGWMLLIAGGASLTAGIGSLLKVAATLRADAGAQATLGLIHAGSVLLALVAMLWLLWRAFSLLARQRVATAQAQTQNGELAAAHRHLAEREALLRETLQRTPLGLATLDIDGRLRSANTALCEMLGYAEAELLELSIHDITHLEDLDRDLELIDECLAGGRQGYRMIKRYLHRSGRAVEVQIDAALLRDAQGHPLHFVVQTQDVTRRMREERMLEVRACTDDLTALPNRRAFFEEGHRMLARAQRQREYVTLVMMDLDHFKSINDTYGHVSGDRVLRAVKEVLTPRLRAGDLLARLGGEEFAILLPDTSPQYARFVAERIRDSIAAAEIYALDGRRIVLTASLGLALISGRETLASAMERADQALYRAKTAGRNCVVEAAPRAPPNREPDTMPLSLNR